MSKSSAKRTLRVHGRSILVPDDHTKATKIVSRKVRKAQGPAKEFWGAVLAQLEGGVNE